MYCVQHSDVLNICNERKYLKNIYTDEEGDENKDEGGDEESTEESSSTEENLNYCDRTCPTVRMLRQDCRQECLVINEDNKCPACNRTCLQGMFVEC